MHSLLCVYAVGSIFLCTCLSLHSSACWYALKKTVKYVWKCIKACDRVNRPCIAHELYVPYSRKLSREKTFVKTFEGENFCDMVEI